MIDLGEEIYEILSENGWEIVEWGERIGRGWFYEIEYLADCDETVIETIECADDSKEAFVDGIRKLAYGFDSLSHVADWTDSSDKSVEDLLNDANEISDSLDDLRIALEDIDFEDEEMM